jgi:hypothetical protein
MEALVPWGTAPSESCPADRAASYKLMLLPTLSRRKRPARYPAITMPTSGKIKFK